MAEFSHMKDHPLGLAARYNDADCEEKGFPAVFPPLGLKMDDALYIAEQRALRVLTGNQYPSNKTVAVRLDPVMVEQLVTLQACTLDGIVIGWRAHMITLRDADNG